MKVTIFVVALLTLMLAACASPAPALVPTAPPQPIPTLAPATVTPALSLAPTPSTPSATTTSSTISPALAPTSTGSCTNAFHPVSTSARWEYRATGSGSTTPGTYTVTLTNITSNSFVEHYTLTNAAFDIQWQCSSDGLRAAALPNLVISGQTPFHLETTSSSGVTLAPTDQWTTGTMWSSTYAVQGQAALNNVTISGSGNVNIQDTVMDQEQVTVPAGTFQAFRVDSAIKAALTGSGAGASLPIVMSFKRSSWYASNVGLVKMVVNLDSQSATTELAGFTP